MSDNLYDGFLGTYVDDYGDYMMTSGMEGGGGDDIEDDADDNGEGGGPGDKILLADPEAARVPTTPHATGRFFKKARIENDGVGAEGEEEEAKAAPPHVEPDGKDPGPRGGDNFVDHVSASAGTGATAETQMETVTAGFDAGAEDVDEDDPQEAEFREHTEEELGRVCSTLQSCLQDLAGEFLSYYRATVHVKKVYEHVLEKEQAESRRLDALEPQVRLLKDLARTTAGMGGPVAALGGTAASGGGGAVGFASAMAPAAPVPMPAAASEGRSRSAPDTPAFQKQPPRRHLAQGTRH